MPTPVEVVPEYILDKGDSDDIDFDSSDLESNFIKPIKKKYSGQVLKFESEYQYQYDINLLA